MDSVQYNTGPFQDIPVFTWTLSVIKTSTEWQAWDLSELFP